MYAWYISNFRITLKSDLKKGLVQGLPAQVKTESRYGTDQSVSTRGTCKESKPVVIHLSVDKCSCEIDDSVSKSAIIWALRCHGEPCAYLILFAMQGG